jgi:hypothetical protein
MMETVRSPRGGLPALLTVAAVAGLLALAWSEGALSRRHLVALLALTYMGVWAVFFALSRAPVRERCARFVVTLLSLAATWALLEGITLAGLIDARALLRTPSRYPWLEPGNRYDPELLWMRNAGLHVSGYRYRSNVAMTTEPRDAAASRGGHDLVYDREGFRNERDLDTADVAIVGDSFVEGTETPHALTFPALLADSTGQVVANLGTGGYGPQQDLAVLRRYAVPLKPRVVLWAFYEGNDLNDVPRYDHLRAELAAGLRTRPTVIERSLTTNALGALYRLAAKPVESGRYGVYRTGPHAGERVYFVDACDRLGPRDLGSVRVVERCWSEAAAIARREGFRFAVLFVPSKHRVMRDEVDYPEASVCRDWEGNDLPVRLSASLARVAPEATFIDLTPVLSAPLARGEITYLADDTHWNARGHAVVARTIAAFLRATSAGTSPVLQSAMPSTTPAADSTVASSQGRPTS